MSRFLLAVACSAVLLLAQGAAASADDWPIFLGPHGTGVTTDAGISDHWPAAGPPVVWSKRIGTGLFIPFDSRRQARRASPAAELRNRRVP